MAGSMEEIWLGKASMNILINLFIMCYLRAQDILLFHWYIQRHMLVEGNYQLLRVHYGLVSTRFYVQDLNSETGIIRAIFCS